MKDLTGILLVNLGTPKSPSLFDVYKYLIEFLTDPRVIDFNWFTRQLLVRGMIVPFRLQSSSKAYKQIWTANGSPLLYFGQKVQKSLQTVLGEAFAVELAMRYQEPSIEKALFTLFKKNPKKIVVIPLFPQYASATTGSVHAKVMQVLSKHLYIPEIKFISQYPTQSSMISAFCALATPYLCTSYDHILFSFHGLPKRHLEKMGKSCSLKDETCCSTWNTHNYPCYSAQCHATAQAIASQLMLPKNNWSISFQSRLGKEIWMQPYTSEMLFSFTKEGKKKILIFSPSFVCDCLETSYEIGIEYAHLFKQAGGELLDLVPGLNDHPLWIEALADLAKKA